jgi:phenylacetate-CoA ligase
LIAIETGNRKARERWQSAQLRNLLKHAATKSAFWKLRIGTRTLGDVELSALPILTRSEVREQVRREGTLPPGQSDQVPQACNIGIKRRAGGILHIGDE